MKRAALAPSAFWKFPTHPEGAAVAGARLTPLADTPRLQTTTPLTGARPTAEPHLLLYFCPVISGPRDRTSQGALAHSFAAARACRALCATRSPGRPCDQDRPLTAPLPPCSSHTSLVCFLAMPVSSPQGLRSHSCLVYLSTALGRNGSLATGHTLAPGTGPSAHYAHFLNEMHFPVNTHPAG